MISDREIIEQIKNGNLSVFNQLFESVYFQLYFHCRKFISDPEDAKDLMQNVFLHFWEKRADIDIHTSLKSYLLRAIHNECLNYLRSQRTVNVSSDGNGKDNIILDYADRYATPDVDYITNEIGNITQTTIDQLPEQCKAVFTLSRMKGLRNQEIAKQLNISVRTVDTQIYRALKILKVKLKDYLAVLFCFL